MGYDLVAGFTIDWLVKLCKLRNVTDCKDRNVKSYLAAVKFYTSNFAFLSVLDCIVRMWESVVLYESEDLVGSSGMLINACIKTSFCASHVTLSQHM